MTKDNQQNREHQSFMELALDVARDAGRRDEVPVGAVIVRDGEVISTGANAPVSSHDPTAHAEIRAIRTASDKVCNYRLTGCTLYVTLEPCLMCAGAIIHARIDRLVYGCSDPKGGAAGSLYDVLGDGRLNHGVGVVSGVLAGESSSLLQAFFRTRRHR